MLREDDRPLNVKAWDLATILVGIAVVALVCWLAGAILLFVFPAKWTFIVGLVKIVKTLGKWVFWITSIGALVCYIAGWLIAIFNGRKISGDRTYDDHTTIDSNGFIRVNRR